MKALYITAGIVLALVLQTTLMRSFIGGRFVIDLVMVAVVYAALAAGPVSGLITGTAAGLIQDALSSGIIGIGGLSKSIVGFAAGVIGQQFIVAQSPSRFVVFFAATVVHAALFMGTYITLGLRTFEHPYTAVLSEALANAVVGVVAFQLADLLPGAVERRRLGRSKPRR
jgi:rod shape-determining protein MreD